MIEVMKGNSEVGNVMIVGTLIYCALFHSMGDGKLKLCLI